MQSGRGERAFERAMALGAFPLRIGAEVLDLLEAVRALSAAISV
jgi:hypothetical protein